MSTGQYEIKDLMLEYEPDEYEKRPMSYINGALSYDILTKPCSICASRKTDLNGKFLGVHFNGYNIIKKGDIITIDKYDFAEQNKHTVIRIFDYGKVFYVKSDSYDREKDTFVVKNLLTGQIE